MKSALLFALALAACGEQSPPPGDPPDAGGEEEEDECDPLEQTCGGELACYWRPDALGGPTCAEEGAGGIHAPCAEDADCRAGLACAETLVGMECAPYCDASSDGPCGEPLDECFDIDDEVGTCEFGGCDPLRQNCGLDEACYFDPQADAGLCHTPPGAGAQGATCELDEECAREFHCVDCAGDPRCGRYCDRSNGDADCADLGVACVSIGPDSGDIGVCGPCP